MDIDTVDVGDPTLLFTPQKYREASESAESALHNVSGPSEEVPIEGFDATPIRETRQSNVLSHISPPPISPGSREKYEHIELDVPSDDEDVDILEIVGEYSKDGTRYLYARYDDGIVRRVSLSLSYAL